MKDSVGVVPPNPAASLLRAAAGEALKQLTAVRPIPDEAIHEARKSLKRARAALRLLRDGMTDAAYRRENARLRDAGHLLTPLRDAKSLIDALDSLQKRYARKLPDSGLAPLNKILHANLAKAHRHFHPGATHQSAELIIASG
jgi:CHAD domain-containing protein